MFVTNISILTLMFIRGGEGAFWKEHVVMNIHVHRYNSRQYKVHRKKFYVYDTYCAPRLWAIGYDCGIDNRVKTVIHRSMKEASILMVLCKVCSEAYSYWHREMEQWPSNHAHGYRIEIYTGISRMVRYKSYKRLWI